MLLMPLLFNFDMPFVAPPKTDACADGDGAGASSDPFETPFVAAPKRDDFADGAGPGSGARGGGGGGGGDDEDVGKESDLSRSCGEFSETSSPRSSLAGSDTSMKSSSQSPDGMEVKVGCLRIRLRGCEDRM
jgi:hypothetical protein